MGTRAQVVGVSEQQFRFSASSVMVTSVGHERVSRTLQDDGNTPGGGGGPEKTSQIGIDYVITPPTQVHVHGPGHCMVQEAIQTMR